jgi:hypothetical protein
MTERSTLSVSSCRTILARAADSGADGDLPTAFGGPREEQIGDVRAGNEEHERHGRGEDEERRAHVPHEHRPDRVDREGVIRAESGRELAFVVLRGELELGFCLVERDAGLQPPGDLEEVSLVLGVRIELKREPHLRGDPEVLEVELAEDTDDGVGFSAQGDGAADHVRVGLQPGGPEGTVEDHNFFAARRVFLSEKGPPEEHGRAKGLEEVGRDMGCLELLRRGPAGEVHDADVEGSHVLHDGCLFAIVLELGGRRRGAIALRRGVHENDEAVRIGKRHRPQEHGVHHREHRRVHTDAQGERRNGGQRKCRPLEEHPYRLLQVFHECIHHSRSPTSLDRSPGGLVRRSALSRWPHFWSPRSRRAPRLKPAAPPK